MSAAQEAANRGLRATSQIRLRTDVFDTRAAELGAETRGDQARLCDMDRTNLIRIRGGQTPSLELAMHMAARLDLTVEELFEVAA